MGGGRGESFGGIYPTEVVAPQSYPGSVDNLRGGGMIFREHKQGVAGPATRATGGWTPLPLPTGGRHVQGPGGGGASYSSTTSSQHHF